jgi:hypothetical protein
MKSEQQEPEQGIPIVIDCYGIKVTLKSNPDDQDEQAPRSWSEVRRRLGQHLMRLAVAPTALLATTFESTTRLISGLSRLPSTLAKVISAAHETADEKENLLQREFEIGQEPFQLSSSSETASEKAEVALRRIETILKDLKDKGLDADVIITPYGQILITVGTPLGSQAEVIEATKKAKALLDEPTEYSG